MSNYMNKLGSKAQKAVRALVTAQDRMNDDTAFLYFGGNPATEAMNAEGRETRFERAAEDVWRAAEANTAGQKTSPDAFLESIADDPKAFEALMNAGRKLRENEALSKVGLSQNSTGRGYE